MSWSLGTTCTSGTVSSSWSEQIKTCSLSPGEYTLVCTDSYGNGWNGARVTIQGVKYCDKFIDGSEMQVQVIITGGFGMPVNGNGGTGKKECFCCSFMTQQV